jgi:hypothetical protein
VYSSFKTPETDGGFLWTLKISLVKIIFVAFAVSALACYKHFPLMNDNTI